MQTDNLTGSVISLITNAQVRYEGELVEKSIIHRSSGILYFTINYTNSWTKYDDSLFLELLEVSDKVMEGKMFEMQTFSSKALFSVAIACDNHSICIWRDTNVRKKIESCKSFLKKNCYSLPHFVFICIKSAAGGPAKEFTTLNECQKGYLCFESLDFFFAWQWCVETKATYMRYRHYKDTPFPRYNLEYAKIVLSAIKDPFSTNKTSVVKLVFTNRNLLREKRSVTSLLWNEQWQKNKPCDRSIELRKLNTCMHPHYLVFCFLQDIYQL